jgi:2-oxoglutarate dehydrogenase E1 component
VLPDKNESRQIQQVNWQCAMPTTPANMFHLLRRQIKREFRKPLIIATPKSLLRHPLARSQIDDFTSGYFKQIIPEQADNIKPENVKRLIFCSGKVYYDLVQRRQEKGIENVATVRVEQLSPFPFYLAAEEQAKYPNAEIVWVQEEPMNMGGWTYVYPRMQTAFTVNGLPKNHEIRFIGRKPAGSPAAGKDYVHKKEQEKLVTDALTVDEK